MESDKLFRKNNSSHSGDENSAGTIGELLKKSRAAALGLAVILATGSPFVNCSKVDKPGDRLSLIEGLEDDDDDGYDFIGDTDGGGGIARRGHGYYFLHGAPRMLAGHGLVWGSKPSSAFHGRGYAVMRGGSAGG